MKRDYERFSAAGVWDWKAIEKEADKLLPELPKIEFGTRIQSQSITLAGQRSVDTREFVFKPVDQRFNLEAAIARATRRIASIKDTPLAIPRPLSDTPINRAPIKNPEARCDRCGGPRGGATAGIWGTEKHYCRACYRLNAAETRAHKIAERELKEKTRKEALEKKKALLVDKLALIKLNKSHTTDKLVAVSENVLNARLERASGLAYWLDYFDHCIKKEMPGFDGQHWDSLVAGQKMKDGTSHTLIRSCPDFSDELIEAIDEAEVTIGLPIAKWPSPSAYKDLFATETNKKPLFFSHDAASRMTNATPRLDVRRERPKWKVIRGQWA